MHWRYSFQIWFYNLDNRLEPLLINFRIVDSACINPNEWTVLDQVISNSKKPVTVYVTN